MDKTNTQSIETYRNAETLYFKPRVLVVEDDLTQEPIWSYIVEKASRWSTMMWATGVPEAYKMISDAKRDGAPFDLVISDIFLSGSLTGIDLWEKLDSEMKNHFLMVSSIDPIKVFRQLEGYKSSMYVQKPLNIHDTIETVYGLLQRGA
jgi:response regulator of citrate/malate metabolism